MNYKLEKFWNNVTSIPALTFSSLMNYKLEKFWNVIKDLGTLIKYPYEL